MLRNLVDVAGAISLGKTKVESRKRRIHLPEIVVDALREHLKNTLDSGELVFTAPEGGALRRNNVRRREWKPLVERVALKAEQEAASAGNTSYRFPRVRLYDLRHTCNALMGYLGVPLDLARARMGHSSIKTTVDQYGHLYDSQQEAVANKFDAFLAPLRAQG